ncbi:glycosyltransferase [Candidatus Thiodictyon syntrophicum]|jgi:dolichol-phosphate mannosyltransferase|uniref:Glycosyltransferase n=2 Tax=Candidatus Thiodictyon syntrophicum TaxID=1166950 RepID=A0A2K8UD59_9GAMM|nr:glycosyltransferase [Candidatus Thiodictyon syntrophicum]
MTLISVVIPVYKAEDCLRELYRRIRASLETMSADFEVIFVEDCGGDRSWAIMRDLAQLDPRVKGLQFSRNFGQHYGITAGLDYCRGDWVVVMDCDLQDQPEEIPRLYDKAQEGYDVVYARRALRQDSFFKRMSSRAFYAVFDYLTEQQSDPATANFGIYSRDVIDNFRRMRESVRAFPLFIRWLGFPSAAIDVEHAPRFSGKSSYTFNKLLHLAINSIVAQSNRPLRLSIKFGFVMAFCSLLFGCYAMLRYLIYSVPVMGWTSVIVSIYFLAGLMFINIGFLGLYIGRIYDEAKQRPLYVVREHLNLMQGSIGR